MSSRDQIITTTCALLEQQGYHATGLNEIIRESGSPKGSLYHYFPGGKEQLTVEALARVGQQVLERIRSNLALADDPADAVESFLHMIADAVEQSGFRAGGPITTVAMETASTSDVLRAECDRIYDEWQAAFTDRLVQGGLARKRAERLSILCVAAIEGGVILSRTGRSGDPLRIAGTELASLIRLG